MRAHDIAIFAALCFAACNSFTGVGDLEAEGAGGSSGTVANLPPMVPADGITVTRIEIYQGLQIELMRDGAAVPADLPIVIGREAIFRVYYNVDPGSEGKLVTTRLTLGEEIFEAEGNVGSISNESGLGSTLNVTVPAEMMMPGDWRIDVLEPREDASGDNAAATYPTDPEETAQLLATNPNGPLRVRIVPVQYDADGSGRLPALDEDQLEAYREFLLDLYPVGEVELVVDDPFPYAAPLSATGGWGDLLDAITNYRITAGADPNEYFFGAIRPTEDFGDFCGGGCTAGLGNLAPLGAPELRACVGLGYDRPGSVETAAHEIGHTHGRQHTPCGTSPADPDFPTDPEHADAAIGRWGYSLSTKTLVSNTTHDFMSYCDPTWISDYSFQQIFQRIQAVNGMAFDLAGTPTRWHHVTLHGDGSMRWQPELTLKQPLMAPGVEVTLVTATGTQRVTGHFIPYDHIDGGRLIYPATPGVKTVRMTHHGQLRELAR